MNLDLKKPCANCPFRREGAIELQPGRLEGIIEELQADDGNNFFCHKTSSGKYAGSLDVDEDGFDVYAPSGKESVCAGSAIFMLKYGRPSLSMRFAFATNMAKVEEFMQYHASVIDPD